MLCYVTLCYVCTCMAWRKHLYYMSAEVAALLIYSMHPTGPGRRPLRSRSICTPLCPTRASTPYWGNTGGWWRLPCLKTGCPEVRGRLRGWDVQNFMDTSGTKQLYMYQIDCKAWNMVSRHEKRFSFIKFGQWQFHVLHSNGVQPCLGLMFLALISMNISNEYFHHIWPEFLAPSMAIFVARRAGPSDPSARADLRQTPGELQGKPFQSLGSTFVDVKHPVILGKMGFSNVSRVLSLKLSL